MQTFNRFNKALFLSSIVMMGAVVISCKKKKEDDPTPIVVIDETPVVSLPIYSVDSANYQDAKTLLAMFSELIDSTEAGNIKGRSVSGTRLANMFNNTGSPFGKASLNSSSLKLSDYVHPDVKSQLATYFDQLAVASQSQTYGDTNVAGVVLGTGASTGKLYDTKGLAIYELIEKNLMGALQLHQITAVQLADSSLDASVSNTKRLKKWDMAFGYLGVPQNYSNTTAGSLSFWAGYLKTNDATLGGNISKIMTAFVSGRAAILANNNDAVKANAKIIKEELDKAAAGMAMTYLFRARKYSLNLDRGRKNGTASEGAGFLYATKYNAVKKISTSQLTSILNTIGTNNWSLKVDNIELAINALGGVYGFDTNPTTSKFNK